MALSNSSAYDVIIVGLGAMGSAAAYHLAGHGLRVLGIDRFTPPHTLGSSHGQTRIIREAYFEDPSYVPIIQRAYELWADLEKASGRPLFTQTGGLMLGPSDGELVTGAERSARQHELPYERLSPDEVMRRYPAMRPEGDMACIFDPRAGILYPEACIEAHLDLASGQGAELHYDERVTSWEPDGDGVTVATDGGRYGARHLVLAAGAWMKGLVPDLALPLEVERQVLFWFEPRANRESFAPEQCPIFVWDYGRDRHFYGFPDLGEGVKVARMHLGEVTDPDDVRREVGDDDSAPVRSLLERFMPDAAGNQISAEVCMFTNTPDLHFLLDFHPEYRRVLVASPCSGHGFKFASAIGEIIAGLVTHGHSRLDVGLFGLSRFGT